MSDVKILKQASPYLRKKSSVNRMMIDVLIALLPAFIFAIVCWKLKPVMVLGISMTTMLSSEFIFALVTKRLNKFSWANILSASVSALIFTLILPASVNWYVTLIGSLAGILIGKLLFGGLGSNIFNPAAVGMVVVKLSFPKFFNASSVAPFDVDTGATVLSSLTEEGGSFANFNNYSILDLLIGRQSGTMGEICAIAIIVGLAYLLIRRSADFRPIVAYLGSFFILMAVAGIVISNKVIDLSWGQFIGVEMLSGGLLFGAAFMISDPVTSPINRPGRYLYGIIAGVCTVFIRLFAALPEGVVFSILIANMFAPVIDYYKWSTNKFTKKNIIIMACVLFIPLILMTLILCFGGIV